MTEENVTGNTDDLCKAAEEVFSHLEEQWQSQSNSYWQLGHSFDTILDYFAYVDGSRAAGFAHTALEAYGRSRRNSACWYDDFGWWGIAALKAAQNPELFNDISPFEKIYKDCWQTMHSNAPNVWVNNKDNPAFAPLEPCFEGGVWNCDWSRPDGCGNVNRPPTLPSQCTWRNNGQGENLTGIQNTVTNGLYLVLALRLFETIGTPDHWDAAVREYDFLNQWFTLSDSENALLRPVGVPVPGEEDTMLVRERVATYRSGARVCGYHPDLSWSGDQGLVVGALIDRMIVEPGDNNPDSMPFRHASAILKGVEYVTNEKSGGVLQPWTSGQGGDPADYSTGVGVFMRYLLYADQCNTYIRKYVTRRDSYRKLIQANVKTVPMPIKDGPGLVQLINYLAILVAAIVMLRDEDQRP